MKALQKINQSINQLFIVSMVKLTNNDIAGTGNKWLKKLQHIRKERNKTHNISVKYYDYKDKLIFNKDKMQQGEIIIKKNYLQVRSR